MISALVLERLWVKGTVISAAAAAGGGGGGGGGSSSSNISSSSSSSSSSICDTAVHMKTFFLATSFQMLLQSMWTDWQKV
jgi:hypothetical protein